MNLDELAKILGATRIELHTMGTKKKMCTIYGIFLYQSVTGQPDDIRRVVSPQGFGTTWQEAAEDFVRKITGKCLHRTYGPVQIGIPIPTTLVAESEFLQNCDSITPTP